MFDSHRSTPEKILFQYNRKIYGVENIKFLRNCVSFSALNCLINRRVAYWCFKTNLGGCRMRNNIPHTACPIFCCLFRRNLQINLSVSASLLKKRKLPLSSMFSVLNALKLCTLFQRKQMGSRLSILNLVMKFSDIMCYCQ